MSKDGNIDNNIQIFDKGKNFYLQKNGQKTLPNQAQENFNRQRSPLPILKIKEEPSITDLIDAGNKLSKMSPELKDSPKVLKTERLKVVFSDPDNEIEKVDVK